MDKTRKLYLILSMIVILTIVNLTSAEQETLGVFKKGECINLIQTCSNCTYNNISSVVYPNSTQALGQAAMTKTGTKYNYTFCTTNITGQYIVNGFGDVDGVVTVWAYDFNVNPLGNNFTIPESIMYILFLGILVIIFLLSLFGTIIIPFYNDRDEEENIVSVNDAKYIKVILFFITYFLLIAIVALTRFITENLIFHSSIHKIFSWMFWLLWAAFIPMITLAGTFLILMWLNDKKVREALERGVPFNDR